MPKCPVCNSGMIGPVAWSDIDRSVYIDAVRYPLSHFEYRFVKLLHAYYPDGLTRAMAELSLYGPHLRGSKLKSIKVIASRARKALRGSRVSIDYLGRTGAPDEMYKLLIFDR